CCFPAQPFLFSLRFPDPAARYPCFPYPKRPHSTPYNRWYRQNPLPGSAVPGPYNSLQSDWLNLSPQWRPSGRQVSALRSPAPSRLPDNPRQVFPPATVSVPVSAYPSVQQSPQVSPTPVPPDFPLRKNLLYPPQTHALPFLMY